MRLRMGLFIGFLTGYYLGAMAGRERYDQLNRMVRKVKKSNTFDATAHKARGVVDLGVGKAKDAAQHRLHHNGDSTPTTEFMPS